MPPLGKQKSTCFQYRKQVLGELLGFGSGALPFSLFNPSANQDNGKQRKKHCPKSGSFDGIIAEIYEFFYRWLSALPFLQLFASCS